MPRHRHPSCVNFNFNQHILKFDTYSNHPYLRQYCHYHDAIHTITTALIRPIDWCHCHPPTATPQTVPGRNITHAHTNATLSLVSPSLGLIPVSGVSLTFAWFTKAAVAAPVAVVRTGGLDLVVAVPGSVWGWGWKEWQWLGDSGIFGSAVLLRSF
jgi:hypothetical protein